MVVNSLQKYQKKVKASHFALISQLCVFLIFGASFASYSYYFGNKIALMQSKLGEIMWEATRINSMSLGVDQITSEILSLSQASYVDEVRPRSVSKIESKISLLKKEFYAIDFYQTKSDRPLLLSRQVVSSTVRLSRAAGYIKTLMIKYEDPNDVARIFLSSPILSEILEVKKDLAIASSMLDDESTILVEEIQAANKNAQLTRIFTSIFAVVVTTILASQINKVVIKPFLKINDILLQISADDLNEQNIDLKLPFLVNDLKHSRFSFAEASQINEVIISLLSKIVYLNDSHKNLSLVDPVTNLGGRLSFENESVKMIDHCRRENKSIVLMSADIKDFRRFKIQGNNVADKVLEEVAAALLSVARRPLDQVFRIDGDEYAIIFYDVDFGMIDNLMKQCCSAVSSINTEFANICDMNHEAIQIEVGFAFYDGKKNLEADQYASSAVIKNQLVEKAKLNLVNAKYSYDYTI